MFCQEDLTKIEKLSGWGLEFEQIAYIFNVDEIELTALMREQPEVGRAFRRGRAKAAAKVTEAAFNLASSGKNAQMTIFWLKCQQNWKETQVVETKEAKLEDLVNGATQKEESDNVYPINKKVD